MNPIICFFIEKKNIIKIFGLSENALKNIFNYIFFCDSQFVIFL